MNDNANVAESATTAAVITSSEGRNRYHGAQRGARTGEDTNRYHGAQVRVAKLGVDTPTEPSDLRKSTMSYPDRRDARRNLGVGPQWRPKKETRDDRLVRMLGQVMERIIRLEEQVDRLLHVPEKAPEKPPVPLRRKASNGKKTLEKSENGEEAKPIQDLKKSRRKRRRKARDYDGKRVAGDAERPSSPPTSPESKAKPKMVEPRTRPSVASLEASQSLARRKDGKDIIPEPEDQQRIRDFPMPRNRGELLKFIDATRALREFVPGFELIAAPLTGMLSRRKHKFHWSPEARRAWHEVKAALAGSLRLRQPQPGKAYHVRPEAKDIGMICTLFQVDNEGQQQVVSQTSAKYRPAENKYEEKEKKALAVVWTLRTQRERLKDQAFTLHSEDGSLEWLKQHQETSARLSKWNEVLEGSRYIVARRMARREPSTPEVQLPEENQLREERAEKVPVEEMVLNTLQNVTPSPRPRASKAAPVPAVRRSRGQDPYPRDEDLERREDSRGSEPEPNSGQRTAEKYIRRDLQEELDRRERYLRRHEREEADKELREAIAYRETPSRRAIERSSPEYGGPEG